MSVFDDVVFNAKSLMGEISKKTVKAIDKSKIKISINEINSELLKNYQALGTIAYDYLKDNSVENENVSEYLDKIKELNSQLDALKESLSSIEEEIKCPICGSGNVKDAVYCIHCGNKL